MIGAAVRPGRRSDREQGPAHGAPHARPGDAQPRFGQERHDVHRGEQRVHRRRQGEGGISSGGRLGSPGRDRRPISRQGPAGRHRGSAPDPLLGRRQGRPPLEDRDRGLARRDAVRAQEEGLRGAAGGRFARRPGRGPRRGAGDGAHRRAVVRPPVDRRGRGRRRRRHRIRDRRRGRGRTRSHLSTAAARPPPRRRRKCAGPVSRTFRAGSAARTRRLRR